MPAGNSYPAPQLPLNGTEQFTLYQQQGAIVVTCTATISQIFEGSFSPVFASPPPIGNITPNTGAFTNLTVTMYEVFSTSQAVTAAGTTQATATLLTTPWSNITTVAPGTGIILNSTTPIGSYQRVFMSASGGNTLSVYPPVGSTINPLGTNAAAGMVLGQVNDFCRITATQWAVK